MDKQRSDVDAMADHMAQPRVEELADNRIVYLCPPGWQAVEKTVDLSTQEANPTRKTGKVVLHDVESFVSFVKREGAQEGEVPSRITSIYVDADYDEGSVKLAAVINDHGALPQWRDYRAVYEPAKSAEWNLWAESDKRVMSQAEFAEFIENNSKDITSEKGSTIPTSGDMLKMALTFEHTAEARIKSTIRSLQSGTATIEYSDAEDDATLKRMEAFTRFQIGIAVFFNGQAFRIDSRLKYRQTAGKLAFWYELIRPDLQVQEATRGLIAQIKSALPNIPVLMGVP